MQHRSCFDYSLGRPYPYCWFTPVVLILGAVLTAVFTVINFASSGYLLESIYSPDPNATTSKSYFDGLPTLFAGKVRPTCQSVSIPVNTKFFTNNTALRYTLKGVTGGAQATLPALIYHNNALEECIVQSVQLQFDAGT